MRIIFTRKEVIVTIVLIMLVVLWSMYITNACRMKTDTQNYLHPYISRMLFEYDYGALLQMPRSSVILMPVRGILVRQIGDTWGAPRSGGRKHEGQDIFAKRGTPIYSGTSGIVSQVGQSRLGGNIVMITGPGGWNYYYAHLDAINPYLEIGMAVTTDTYIGTVGNTGNAATTPSHLHFGVYMPGLGATDPLPMLVNRK